MRIRELAGVACSGRPPDFIHLAIIAGRSEGEVVVKPSPLIVAIRGLLESMSCVPWYVARMSRPPFRRPKAQVAGHAIPGQRPIR